MFPLLSKMHKRKWLKKINIRWQILTYLILVYDLMPIGELPEDAGCIICLFIDEKPELWDCKFEIGDQSPLRCTPFTPKNPWDIWVGVPGEFPLFTSNIMGCVCMSSSSNSLPVIIRSISSFEIYKKSRRLNANVTKHVKSTKSWMCCQVKILWINHISRFHDILTMNLWNLHNYL